MNFRRGNIGLIVLPIIIVVSIVLFAPIPTVITGQVLCAPCVDRPDVKCPPCPQKGQIEWQSSIAMQIWQKFFDKSNIFPTKDVPITWDECVKTPGAMETASYPATCSTPDGRHAIQPLSEEEKRKLLPPTDKDNGASKFQGSSTLASCSNDGGCKTSGCNAEICQGSGEESAISACIALTESPKSQGYNCKCVTNKCQWTK